MILLSPQIHFILCASFFAFDELAFCENANVRATATEVSATREPFVSGVTRHCSDHPPDGPEKPVTETGSRAVVRGGRKPRNLNGTVASTTTKPKVQPKPAGPNKAPQRPSNVTIPMKPGGGRGSRGGVPKNPWKPRNTTAWPRPDKRLSDGVRKAPPTAAAAATTAEANQTDESVVVADFKARYPVDMWKDHGFYTDEYMQLINGHWFKFEPPNATSHYVLGSLYAVIMVFGCFGNFLVIFMYIKLVYALG